MSHHESQMKRIPHGLFLTFEGLPATVFQSQVFARLQWLVSTGIATFDVLSLAPSRSLFNESVQRAESLRSLTSIAVTVGRSLKSAVPGSIAWNQMILNRFLASTRHYDFIHARTDYAAAIASRFAVDSGTPLVWDCRGDSEGEFRERWAGFSYPTVIDWRARLIRAEGERAARSCTTASFVSRPLAQLWRDALGSKRSVVIPCVGDDRLFYFDPALRAAERARLGYASDDIVFVYSGSLNPYQGLDLLIEWFARASARLRTWQLLVLTPYVQQARAQLVACDPARLKIISAPFDRMNDVLNAADFGLMLRPECRTNRAAFPTKFAEYGLAGLRVVLTPAVPDCYAIAQAAGNLAAPTDDPCSFSSLNCDRERIAAHYRATLTHTAMSDRYRALYSFGS